MEGQLSVLEKLQIAYELVADALGQAPVLHDTHLDQALLVLVLAMKRARRSKHLSPSPPPRQRSEDYDDHDLPF
jgi:hypothetical protein